MKIWGKLLKVFLVLAVFAAGYVLGSHDLFTRSAAAKIYPSSGEMPPNLIFNVFDPNEFGSDSVRQIEDTAKKVICYSIKNGGGISCVKY